jgi:spermidine synthase
MSDVEKSVREFYEFFGWKKVDRASGEDRLFRQYSKPHQRYAQGVYSRLAECLHGLSGRLLIAGGGDLPTSHVALAQAFASTTCVDISETALALAKSKLGDRGTYVQASILDY